MKKDIEILSKGLAEAVLSRDPTILRAYVSEKLSTLDQVVQENVVNGLKERLPALELLDKDAINTSLDSLKQSVSQTVGYQSAVKELQEFMEEYGIIVKGVEGASASAKATADKQDDKGVPEYQSPWYERAWEGTKSAAKSTSDGVSNWWGQTAMNPGNWNKETKIVAGIAAVTAVALGVYWFTRSKATAVVNNAKKKAAVAAERARAGKTDLVVVGTIALVGLLAAFGLPHLMKWLNPVNKLQSEIDTALARKDEILAKIAKAKQDGLDEVAERYEAQLEVLEGNISFLQEKNGELTETLSKKGDQVKGVTESTVNAVKEKTAPVVTAARESVDPLVASATALAGSTTMQQALDNTAKKIGTIALSKYLSSEKVDTVIERMDLRGWKVKDILDCYHSDTKTFNEGRLQDALNNGSDAIIPPQATDRKSYEKAARDVIEFCYDYRLSLQTAAGSREKFMNLPASEISNMVSGPARAIIGLSTAVQSGEKPSMSKFISGLSENGKSVMNRALDHSFYTSRGVEDEVLSPEHQEVTLGDLHTFLLRMNLGGKSLSHFTSGDENVRAQLLNPELSVEIEDENGKTQTVTRSLVQFIEELNNLTEQRDELANEVSAKSEELSSGDQLIIQSAIDKLNKQIAFNEDQIHFCRAGAVLWEIIDRRLFPDGKRLAVLFHRTHPNHNWSENEKENYKLIDGYLQDMSLERLLNWVSLDTMMRNKDESSEQVAGLIGLQYDVLNLIGERDEGFLYLKRMYKVALQRMVADFATPSFRQEAADSLDVSVEVIDQAAEHMIAPAKKFMQITAIGAAMGPMEIAEWYWSLQKTCPWLFYTAPFIGTMTGVKGIGLSKKLLLWRFNRLQTHRAIANLRNTASPRWYTPLRYAWQKFIPAESRAWRDAAGAILSKFREHCDVIDRMPVRSASGKSSTPLAEHLIRWMDHGADPDQIRNLFTRHAADLLSDITAEIDNASSLGLSVDEVDALKKRAKRINDLLFDVKRFVEAEEHAPARAALRRYARPFGDYFKNTFREVNDTFVRKKLDLLSGEILDDLVTARAANNDKAVRALLRNSIFDDALFRQMARDGHPRAKFLMKLYKEEPATVSRLLSQANIRNVVEQSCHHVLRGDTGISDVIDQYGANRALARRARFACGKLLLSPDEALPLLEMEHTLQFLGNADDCDGQLEKALLHLNRIQDSTQRAASVERIARFFREAGDDFDPKIIRAVAESGVEDVSDIMKAAQVYKATPDKAVRVIKGLAKWQNAGNLSRGLVHIGVGAGIAMLIVDSAEALAATERVNKVMEQLEESLIKAGYVREEGKKHGFYHEKTGAKVSLRELKDSTGSLDDAQWARVAGDAMAAIPAGIIWAVNPALLLGPTGWVLIGVEVVAQGVTSIWEQVQNRAYVAETPTPVLALQGSGATLGEREADAIAGASNGAISDWYVSSIPGWVASWVPWVPHAMGIDEPLGFNAGPLAQYRVHDVEVEKKQYRKKIFCMLLYREMENMRRVFPELADEILGEDVVSFFSGSFDQDFDRILRPFMAARLYQMSNDDTVNWVNFSQLKTDEGWFDLENVTQAQLQMVAREALHIYAAHKREIDLRSKHAELQEVRKLFEEAEEGSTERADLSARVVSLASKLKGTVYGLKADQLPALEEGVSSTTEQLVLNLEQGLDDSRMQSVPTYSGTRTMTRTGSRDVPRLKRWTDPKLFTIKLPPELNPQSSKRSINVATLAGLAFEGGRSNVEINSVSYWTTVQKATTVHEMIKDVGTLNGAWFMQYDHYTLLKDYALWLAGVPEFDQNAVLRNSIKSLDRWKWTEEGGSYDYLQKRSEDGRKVISAVKDHVAWLAGHRHHYDERASDQRNWSRIPRFVGYRGAVTSMRNNPSILIDIGGKTQKLTWDPGVEGPIKCPGLSGEFFCDVRQEYSTSGNTSTIYSWSYKTNKQESFACLSENEYGVKQPGTHFDFSPSRVGGHLVSTEAPVVFYRRQRYIAHLTLVDGTKVTVKNDTFKGNSDVELELAKHGVTLTKEKRDITNRKLERKHADGTREAPKWGTVDQRTSRDPLLKFTLDPKKVQSLELENWEPGWKGEQKERYTVVDKKEYRDSIKNPSLSRRMRLAASDRVNTVYDRQCFVDRLQFTMQIELLSGEVVSGTSADSEELQRYVDFTPRAAKDYVSQEWMNGSWVEVKRDQVEGWNVRAREGAPVRTIVFHGAGGNRQVIRFFNSELSPDTTPDSDQMPFMAMGEDAWKNMKQLITVFGLAKSKNGEFYERRGVAARYVPRPDGTFYKVPLTKTSETNAVPNYDEAKLLTSVFRSKKTNQIEGRLVDPKKVASEMVETFGLRRSEEGSEKEWVHANNAIGIEYYVRDDGSVAFYAPAQGEESLKVNIGRPWYKMDGIVLREERDIVDSDKPLKINDPFGFHVRFKLNGDSVEQVMTVLRGQPLPDQLENYFQVQHGSSESGGDWKILAKDPLLTQFSVDQIARGYRTHYRIHTLEEKKVAKKDQKGDQKNAGEMSTAA